MRTIINVAGAGVLALLSTTSRPAEAYSARILEDQNVASFKPLLLPPGVYFQDDGCILYVQGLDGNLWREDYCNGPGVNQRTYVDGNVIDYQTWDGTTIYVLGSDRKLWREVGNLTNRTMVDATVQDFLPIDGTWVLVRGTDGKLWLEDGNLYNRILLDGAAGEYQAVGGVYYVTHSDKTLWRIAGDMSGMELVSHNVAAFKALDASKVYVLGTDGALWNYTNTWKNRFLVDRNVESFAPDGPQDILVLGTNNNLWREFGTMSNRDFVDSSLWIDGANPREPFFAWEPMVSGDPNIFVLGSDHKLWLEGMPVPGTPMPQMKGPTMTVSTMPPPPPICFECYANCGVGCIAEGMFCSLIDANAAAPGCGVCCGAQCANSATCLD